MSAMPAERTETVCPACGRHSLVMHCAAGRCTWAVCRNKQGCDLIFDTHTGRGHRLARHGENPSKVARILWAKDPK